MQIDDVTFPSRNEHCAAWLYLPDDRTEPVACVVMAHGFSMSRRDGLSVYAERLTAAGVAVLVFDFRYLGDSGGSPRQRFRTVDHEEDYLNAIRYIRSQPSIDPDRVVLWGFSSSGGTAVNVAARDHRVAGLILTCPLLDARQRSLQAARAAPAAVAWLLPRAIADVVGRHNLVPVTGPLARALR